jgi:hypothetical protein
MGKGGSVSVREGTVMSQDAPVNTGAVSWPGLFSAELAVARMQSKLHLWAARDPVGFLISATVVDLRIYAARSYSLMSPPRTSRRLIRSWERSAAGWSGRGGCNWRLRWGRRPL